VTESMEEAQRLLLKSASDRHDVKTADLLRKVEMKRPNLSADTVRSAYWNLVTDGKLQRSQSGVRKAPR
jgi:hypothetical protein